MVVIKYVIISSLIYLLFRSLTKPFFSSIKNAYIDGKTPPQKTTKNPNKPPKNIRKFTGGEEIEFEEVD